MYRILVTGDRNWTEYPVIFEALSRVWNELSVRKLDTLLERPSSGHIIVIHGAANGADKHAAKAAFMLGMGIRSYPANWTKYGRGAGPIRNSLMIKENQVDRVLAFHDNLGSSKGTRDMVTKAIELGKPVRLYKSDGSYVELNQLSLI